MYLVCFGFKDNWDLYPQFPVYFLSLHISNRKGLLNKLDNCVIKEKTGEIQKSRFK